MAIDVPAPAAAGRAGPPIAIDEERCQGRSVGLNSRRTRPCSRRGRLVVDGAGGLVAVLCGQHARVAADRPGVLWDWLGEPRGR